MCPAASLCRAQRRSRSPGSGWRGAACPDIGARGPWSRARKNLNFLEVFQSEDRRFGSADLIDGAEWTLSSATTAAATALRRHQSGGFGLGNGL